MRLDYPLVNCLHQPLGVLQLVEAPEFLDTLAGLHFGRIDVARAVYRDVVNCSELAGLSPDAAEARQDFVRSSFDDAYFAV